MLAVAASASMHGTVIRIAPPTMATEPSILYSVPVCLGISNHHPARGHLSVATSAFKLTQATATEHSAQLIVCPDFSGHFAWTFRLHRKDHLRIYLTFISLYEKNLLLDITRSMVTLLDPDLLLTRLFTVTIEQWHEL